MIYLLRHGQTEYNVEKRLGGNSKLTNEGIRCAKELSKQLDNIKIDKIYCSTLERSIQTAKIIQERHKDVIITIEKNLEEVRCGTFDSLTYKTFKDDFPGLFQQRQKDKYNWSFPGGESYFTAFKRLEPFLKTINKDDEIVIVGHQAINRLIISYFEKINKKDVCYLTISQDKIYSIGKKSE